MRIGIVEDSFKLAEMFKDGLELSRNNVVVYECAQEAMSAILGARFDNVPLPVEMLIIDLDLCQSAEMIKRLRLFIRPDELSIIAISGRSLIERNIFDVPVLQKPITPGNLLEAVKEEIKSGKG